MTRWINVQGIFSKCTARNDENQIRKLLILAARGRYSAGQPAEHSALQRDNWIATWWSRLWCMMSLDLCTCWSFQISLWLGFCEINKWNLSCLVLSLKWALFLTSKAQRATFTGHFEGRIIAVKTYSANGRTEGLIY